MRNVFFLLIALIVLITYSCKTKPKPEPVTNQSSLDVKLAERMWKTIDSLEQKGLIATALEEVRKIKKAALEGNDSGHLVKAIMHENKYLVELEEDSAIKALARLEEEIKTYPEPARSVAHSLAGQDRKSTRLNS